MGIMGRITGKKVDYSSMSRLPNVDTMCEVLRLTQIEMGEEPSMQEAAYDKSGQKIRRFRRCVNGTILDTRTGELINMDAERDYPYVDREIDLYAKKKVRVAGNVPGIADDKKIESDEKITQKQKKKEKRVPLLEGGFERFYNRVCGYEDDDDDNDEYVCEYCSKLGYSGKYKSYICDNCTKCETCAEFQDDKCDGCSYSKTRTGRLYSESLTQEQLIDVEDLEIIRDKESATAERRKSGKFSSLNY